MAIPIDPRKDATQSYDLNGRVEITTKDSPISNGMVHPVTLSYLQYIYDMDHAHAEQVVQYREYYDGDQISYLTDRQRKYLEVGTDVTFRLNAMTIPVDIMAERMKVTGFTVRDDSEADPQSGQDGALWRWWEHNRMDAQQVKVHRSAALDGDTYAIVGWDNNSAMPTIRHELEWDGSQGVIVRYRPDDRNKVWYGVKRWVVDRGQDGGKVSYMTAYFDDRIENYTGSVGGRDWERLPDEDGNWPIPFVKRNGAPMGCPVFHLANRADGTGFGISELKDLIGPQNALDKCVIDELGIADAMGFPIRTATGIEVGDNLTVSPGSILSTQSEVAKFGQLPSVDIGNLSALVEKWVTRIAQISRTPLTFFQTTGQVARADTQKAGDSPLVSKVRAQSVATGNFWEDVMFMCRRLYNEYGGGVQYDENIISTEWDNFESIDVQNDNRQKADTGKIKAEALEILMDRFPRADPVELAKLAGYNDDEARVFDVPTTGFIQDGLEQ